MTQVTGQDTKIMEAAEFMEEEPFTFLKDLITETTTSSPYYEDNSQLNLVNCVTEDGDSSPTAPNPTALSSHEKTWELSPSCNPLGSFSTENYLPSILGTSAGALTNYATLDDGFMPMDELAIMGGRYGALPSIQKTAVASIAFDGATSSFNNDELFHWLGQHLTGPLPGLTELTDTYPITDLPIAPPPRKNITLVLDLDETLVHSRMSDCDGADFSFPMFLGTKEHTVYAKKRPYVDIFLRKVAELFEIVIFTASLSTYANQLIDMLDPENKLISQRFFRESCVLVDESYIKDLTIIGDDLSKVVIIDNSPEVFQLQVNNGIPIESWSSDPSDLALLELIPFLETLAVADDVRPIIASKFGNQSQLLRCYNKH